MSEVQSSIQEASQVVKSMGEPVKTRLAITEMGAVENVDAAPAKAESKKEEVKGEVSEKKEAAAPEMDEKVIEFLKSKGLEASEFETLVGNHKAKVDKKEAAEKEKQYQTERERKAVDVFVQKGGTVEMYASLKQIAEGDLASLSRSQAEAELIESGFSKEKAEEIISDKFFQFSDEDIEEMSEEEQEYAKKLREYGTAKLNTYAAHSQSQAKELLETIYSTIEADALSVKQETDTSAKVDEVFQAFERKAIFDLGEEGSSPIEYEISDKDLNEAKEFFKQNINFKSLLTAEGEPNAKAIKTLVDKFVRAQVLESAVKVAYLQSANHQVDIFRTHFPNRDAHTLGIGTSPQRKYADGEVVSIGQPQRVRSAFNN